VTAVLIGLAVGDLDPLPAPASLGWLALLGITSQSAGYLLISLSLPRLPAVLTSIILLAQPVVTVGLSIVLLAETPSQAQLAGGALVIGGIAVAMLGGRPTAVRQTRPAAAES
jgi:drug/metabolite transporter (DMT)-like permease